MNIIVCIKQVPDTTEVKLDPKTGTLIREGIPSIMNPDDKAALEAALTIKDNFNATVHVITMGPTQAEAVLREALAMGADKAYLLTDKAFSGADTLATSTTLAAAIRKIDFDLILAGRQAIDGDTAQVGPQIAEHLGIPNISYAEEIEITDGEVSVKRWYEDRYHLVKAKLPCLITVLGEMNTPRYMTPGGIFDAFDKEITVWTRSDVEVDDSSIGLKGSPTRVVASYPKSLKGAGEKKVLDTEEAVEYLLGKLRERGII